MKSLSIIFLLLIAGYGSIAQSNFREECIVTSTNDANRGLLSKGLNDADPNDIQIKSGQNAEAIANTPSRNNASRLQDEAHTKAEKDQQGATVSFGIGAGFNASKLLFSKNSDRNFQYLREGNYSSYGPSVMASAFVSSPDFNDNLNLRVDLIYSSFNYSDRVIRYWGYKDANQEINNVEIKLHTLSIPVSLQYLLKEGNLSTYLNFGGSFNYHLRASNALSRESIIGDKVTTEDFDAFHKSNTQFGLWAGFGINKMLTKKLPGFLELRLEGTTGVLPGSYSNQFGLTSNQGTAYILTGVRF